MKQWIAGIVVLWAAVAWGAPCNTCTRAQKADSITPGFTIPCAQTTCSAVAPVPTTTAVIPPVTSTTMPVAGNIATTGSISSGPANQPMIQMNPDGTIRQAGGLMGRLPDARSTVVGVGSYWCGGNGEIYQATVAGTTAPVTPLTVPIQRLGRLTLRAGQIVFPGYGGVEAPGFQYRVNLTAGTCTTSSAKFITWPKVLGAVVQDGSCPLIAQALQDANFVDGTARFVYVPTMVDAYACAMSFTAGQNAPTANVIQALLGDNGAPVIGVGRMQTVGSYGASAAETGHNFEFASGGGDGRRGEPATEIQGSLNDRVLQVSGGPPMEPPYLPPVVQAMAGGVLPLRTEQFTVTYRDGLYDAETAGCATRACQEGGKVTLTAGVQTIKVTYPEDATFQWPIPIGGARKSQTAVFVYRGNTAWWGSFWCVLRKPGDACIATSDGDFQENPTISRIDRDGRPLFNVNDVRRYRVPWQPNLPVVAMRTVVAPTEAKKTLHLYVAVGVQCDATGSTCKRGTAWQGVTPVAEPDWYTAVDGFIVDAGGNLWMQLPISEVTTVQDHSLLITEMTSNGPKPALLIDSDCIRWYDWQAADPLRAVKKEWCKWSLF